MNPLLKSVEHEDDLNKTMQKNELLARTAKAKSHSMLDIDPAEK
jgi:hypothetical protein